MEFKSCCFHRWNLVILLAILVTLPSIVVANDDSEGWHIVPANSVAKNFYGGIGLGRSDNDSPDSNQDGSVTGVSIDDRDTTKSFYVGYQINDHFAVEGGHHDLGESDFRGTSSGGPSWDPGSVRTLQEADGWELGILGRWPIAPRWYALGYIGMYWWDYKETYYESSGVSGISESGSDITYALGFEYDIGMKDRIVYRFMGAHHEVGKEEFDINSATAAIVYRFP